MPSCPFLGTHWDRGTNYSYATDDARGWLCPMVKGPHAALTTPWQRPASTEELQSARAPLRG